MNIKDSLEGLILLDCAVKSTFFDSRDYWKILHGNGLYSQVFSNDFICYGYISPLKKQAFKP